MGDMLGNSLSALVSYQRAIATTSHNIANADTEGYSRQAVTFNTRVPQQVGSFAIGSGVNIDAVRRVYDSFAVEQMRTASNSHAQLSSYYSLSSQLDNALSDPELGISTALSRFYDSVQNVADDPASMSSRQLLLSEASALGDRFADMSSQMDSLDKEVNARITSVVSEINDYVGQIALSNKMIVEARGKFSGEPNDLLDQRDQSLLKLSELVGISTVAQDDGAVNVFVGNGQSLVLGSEPQQLTASPSQFDAQRVEIAIRGAVNVEISDVLSGGSLGGVLAFRDDLLDKSKNELGRIAVAVSGSINDINRAGLDLQGNRGGDIFAVPSPTTFAASTNTGTAAMTANITDIGALTGNNLMISYNGTAWQVFNEASRQPVTGFSGAGTPADPLVVEGLSISVDMLPVAGDRFVVRPVSGAAADLQVVMTDPAGIAAAAATRSAAATTNTGSGSISETRVVDPDNANLTDTLTLSFIAPDTYQVNGSGSFAYTPGQTVVMNGNAFVLNGTPSVGDSFSVAANSGAVGDNRNMLAMAAAEELGYLNGGRSSIADTVNGMVGNIAVATRSTQLNLDSQQALLNQATARVQGLSGVNLDEEAANLLKYQQAYQAAAQATSVANELFQSLMGAFR
ncbi:flagellar hook-associated protein FlgK [Spongiibacter sp. KMU-166]|uniref:Flagellar hook-associated protein 1 n=1 Tax=Spongiibacter thalassae TaxID=2721624 RepID=A0ABX1GC61_9GAMM|nr:flagellar hook-associated protein FlgK [Spongiibacter thalassae]NKI16761.1 flagellar hook-associated protein FlgK [Spongiibacter thalassae]